MISNAMTQAGVDALWDEAIIDGGDIGNKAALVDAIYTAMEAAAWSTDMSEAPVGKDILVVGRSGTPLIVRRHPSIELAPWDGWRSVPTAPEGGR